MAAEKKKKKKDGEKMISLQMKDERLEKMRRKKSECLEEKKRVLWQFTSRTPGRTEAKSLAAELERNTQWE